MGKNTRFISPAKIYARVQEELKSYFNTGSIDNLLFPIWTLDALNKFENTYLPIREVVMDIYHRKCELPCDFHAVREVWACATFNKGPITAPGTFYYQTDCRIEPSPAPGDPCGPCTEGYQCFTGDEIQQPVNLPSLCDVPQEYHVTHKVQTHLNFQFHVTAMLKPGNFRTIGKCGEGCPTDIWAVDTFDIMDNKLITSFDCGTVYMAYYAKHAEMPMDDGPDAGYYMIPDNEPFGKYLYYYLRYMIFDQLFNQATDETFNQVNAKLQRAEQQMWDHFAMAKQYAVAGDVFDVEKSIIRSYNRNNRFLLRGPATRR